MRDNAALRAVASIALKTIRLNVEASERTSCRCQFGKLTFATTCKDKTFQEAMSAHALNREGQAGMRLQALHQLVSQ